MMGFELLLLYLDALQTTDKFKLAFLPSSLNFLPFVVDYSNRDIRFKTSVISFVVIWWVAFLSNDHKHFSVRSTF